MCLTNVLLTSSRSVGFRKRIIFAALMLSTLVATQAGAQVDTLSKIQIPSSANDSSKGITASGALTGDPISSAKPADSLSVTTVKSITMPVPVSTTMGKLNLTNIISASKKIRATGWGEYVVGGHCLCCDNMRSIDCITVQTTNRTDRLRIKQVIDGKIDRDTTDKSTYFGEVYEREMQTKPVAVLMVEVSLPKLQDIYKVEVYTVADSLKRKNVPFNCELAYFDQFDRLQWTKKVANSGKDEKIIFEFEKPVFTKTILLKVRDGRNKITEVAVFAEDIKE
jgi:hypothetical protein